MTARRRPGRRPARAAPGEDASCTLLVERLASGGDGVGTRDDGKTVFVEDAAPGDRVRVRIVEERKRFARARIEAVVEPSADRVVPRCAHFGRCGGCTWQHISYAAQVSAKARILRDALVRIGGFELEDPTPFTASPDAYAYRGRARVRVEAGRTGFLERGSHRLCPIDACPVLSPALEALVLSLASERADGEWSVCVGADGESSVSGDSGAADASRPESASPIEIEVGGVRLGLDARAFSQANGLLHDTLVERVRHVLFDGVAPESRARWRVLELHAGIGFFTKEVANEVAEVVAVESDAAAVEWLERNLAGHDHVEVIHDTFESSASGLALRRFDAVLLDPPRTGLMPSELDALARIAPPRIVYLSCDPATLARDGRGLAEAAGYVLTHVEGFDLFPQTPHTEGLIRLERGEAEDTSPAGSDR